MHFLVLGDTKIGTFADILHQKVLGSTNFSKFLALGDTNVFNIDSPHSSSRVRRIHWRSGRWGGT